MMDNNGKKVTEEVKYEDLFLPCAGADTMKRSIGVLQFHSLSQYKFEDLEYTTAEE